jgi:ferric-dicitrate binding protein FerR (iron transport regulator)
MGAPKAGCERAREWISLDVDEELSELGRARLRAHLAHCPACARAARELRTLATMLADAPLEQPASAVELRPRRRVGLARVYAAAAVVAAAAACGLAGSLTPEPTAALHVPYFEHQLLTYTGEGQSYSWFSASAA